MAGPFNPDSSLEYKEIRSYISGPQVVSIRCLVVVHTPDGGAYPDEFMIMPVPAAAQDAANAGAADVIAAGLAYYGLTQLWPPPLQVAAEGESPSGGTADLA